MGQIIFFRTKNVPYFFLPISAPNIAVTFALADSAKRFFSASRQYLSISESVLWPVIDWISCGVHPASANRHAAALRNP